MTDKKPVAVIVGGGRHADIGRLMVLAALSAGCTIEMGPPPEPVEHDPRYRLAPLPPHPRLLPLQLTGTVEHTYSAKPLTKRQKRRLRGQNKDKRHG